MRTLIGVGTPRGLQGRLAADWAALIALMTPILDRLSRRSTVFVRAAALIQLLPIGVS
jgi:hypothetical protein